MQHILRGQEVFFILILALRMIFVFALVFFNGFSRMPGAAADFCLLDRDWAAARLDLAAVRVLGTWRAGRSIWGLGLDGVNQAPVERGLRGDAAA